VTALLRSEAVKVLATRRTLLAFALALLVLVAIGTVASVQSARHSHPVNVAKGLHDAVSHAAGLVIIIALLFGILVSTWEYQHRTMTDTLLAAPVRERVVAAKAVAALLVGLLLAVVAVALALAIAVPWLGSDAAGELHGGSLWARVGELLVGAGLWGALGALVGALVASQVGAIIASLIWLLVVESLLDAFVGRVAPYLPGQASQALLGADTSGLSRGGGFAVTLAYVAALGALAVFATRRRDIT
jgi:ABC-2 type transport system permease protein